MSRNFAIKGGGGGGRLMANAILNFHFDYLNPSLSYFPWPFLDKTQTINLIIYSSLLHNMFRPSGPDQ